MSRPQVQYIGKVTDMPVVDKECSLRIFSVKFGGLEPGDHESWCSNWFLKSRCCKNDRGCPDLIDRVVDVLVVTQRKRLRETESVESVPTSQVQFVERIADALAVEQRQVSKTNKCRTVMGLPGCLMDEVFGDKQFSERSDTVLCDDLMFFCVVISLKCFFQ